MMDFLTGFGKFLWVIFQVIVLFNLLIVVHELGHYWAAKWRGLKVEKFQIWFGKAIWKKEINGVQWGLGTIPMGGFVALPQMAPMEMLEGGSEDKEQLPPITPLDKIIVAFAGPLFSLGLAFAFALLVWGLGKPEHVRMTTNVVGSVASDYPAAEAGIRPGDEIISIDGVKVSGFGGMVDSITERIVFSQGEKIRLVLRRPGVAEPINLDVGYKIEEKGAMERPDHRRIGIGPASPAFVAAAEEGSPAQKASLKEGDQILNANGEKLHSPVRLMQIAAQGEGKPIELLVLRDGESIPLILKPEKPKTPETAGYLTGIIWDNTKGQSLMRPGPNPFRQVWNGATAIFRTIGSLFSSDSDVSVRHMSSAVGIGNFYYQTLSDPVNGWRLALVLSVLINVNLGLLNLLPFPVLDGGHITMATYEWIRKKPINLRFLEIFQTACALLLIGFMIYVTFYDVGDIIRSDEAVPIRW